MREPLEKFTCDRCGAWCYSGEIPSEDQQPTLSQTAHSVVTAMRWDEMGPACIRQLNRIVNGESSEKLVPEKRTRRIKPEEWLKQDDDAEEAVETKGADVE